MDNNNRGSVWRNDKKQQGDNKPHFTGKAEIGGVEYRVSCWKTDPQSLQENPKRPVLSFQFTSEAEWQAKFNTQGQQGIKDAYDSIYKQAPQQSPQQAPAGTHIGAEDFEDDIPF